MSNENQTEKKCHCKAMKIAQFILLIVITIATLTAAYFSYNTYNILNAIIKGSAPQQATTNNNNETITKKYAKNQTMEKALTKGKPIVAFFYADWCGYCKKFAPTFHTLTKKGKFKSNFAVAYINCDDPANQALVQEYKIQGFPTVYYIDNSTQTKKEIDNNLFFTENAANELLELFLSYIKK